jgi:hypothetical protein
VHPALHPRSDWTRCVPRPVLFGRAASLALYYPDTLRLCWTPGRHHAPEAAVVLKPLYSLWQRLRGGAALRGAHGPRAKGEGARVAAGPPPPPRTQWTRRVPHPVLIGHAASLSQVWQPLLFGEGTLLPGMPRVVDELIKVRVSL